MLHWRVESAALYYSQTIRIRRLVRGVPGLQRQMLVMQSPLELNLADQQQPYSRHGPPQGRPLQCATT